MIEQFGIGVAIVMSGVAILVLVQMWFRSRKKKNKDDSQTRKERASWAWARIENSVPGVVGLGGLVRVSLELEVHLPGSPAYHVTANWFIEQEALKFVETGKEISCKVDPQDQSFVFPNASWARKVE